MKTESIIKPPESRVLKSGKVKLAPGEEVGWHITDQREEIIVILKGSATIITEDLEKELKAGQTYFVPAEVKHNVYNRAHEELEYIYIVSLFKGD